MKVYELLDTPEKWTKGYYACDKRGKDVHACAVTATCWCLMGAVIRCYFPHGTDAVNVAAQKIIKRIGYWAQWNDAPERTYEDVIALARELDI